MQTLYLLYKRNAQEEKPFWHRDTVIKLAQPKIEMFNNFNSLRKFVLDKHYNPINIKEEAVLSRIILILILYLKPE